MDLFSLFLLCSLCEILLSPPMHPGKAETDRGGNCLSTLWRLPHSRVYFHFPPHHISQVALGTQHCQHGVHYHALAQTNEGMMLLVKRLRE